MVTNGGDLSKKGRISALFYDRINRIYRIGARVVFNHGFTRIDTDFSRVDRENREISL